MPVFSRRPYSISSKTTGFHRFRWKKRQFPDSGTLPMQDGAVSPYRCAFFCLTVSKPGCHSSVVACHFPTSGLLCKPSILFFYRNQQVDLQRCSLRLCPALCPSSGQIRPQGPMLLHFPPAVNEPEVSFPHHCPGCSTETAGSQDDCPVPLHNVPPYDMLAGSPYSDQF